MTFLHRLEMRHKLKWTRQLNVLACSFCVFCLCVCVSVFWCLFACLSTKNKNAKTSKICEMSIKITCLPVVCIGVDCWQLFHNKHHSPNLTQFFVFVFFVLCFFCFCGFTFFQKHTHAQKTKQKTQNLKTSAQ